MTFSPAVVYKMQDFTRAGCLQIVNCSAHTSSVYTLMVVDEPVYIGFYKLFINFFVKSQPWSAISSSHQWLWAFSIWVGPLSLLATCNDCFVSCTLLIRHSSIAHGALNGPLLFGQLEVDYSDMGLDTHNLDQSFYRGIVLVNL